MRPPPVKTVARALTLWGPFYARARSDLPAPGVKPVRKCPHLILMYVYSATINNTLIATNRQFVIISLTITMCLDDNDH